MIHPRKEILRAQFSAAAQGADRATPALVVPFDSVIEYARFVPVGTITGANGDTRKLSLVNKGSSGSDSQEIAALQFNSGVNAPAFVVKSLPLSSEAPELSEGDVLAIFSDSIGDGIADPGGSLEIKIRNR